MSKQIALLTVVIRLPENLEDRKKISDALQIGGRFHGGDITAMSCEDEISINEFLEEICSSTDIEEARSRAKELHRTAIAAT